MTSVLDEDDMEFLEEYLGPCKKYSAQRKLFQSNPLLLRRNLRQRFDMYSFLLCHIVLFVE